MIQSELSTVETRRASLLAQKQGLKAKITGLGGALVAPKGVAAGKVHKKQPAAPAAVAAENAAVAAAPAAKRAKRGSKKSADSDDEWRP